MKSVNVIWLNGMPRSGTSWLSQIFDSHPDTRFRLAPLFSYRFKNYLTEQSDCKDCRQFIHEVYNCFGDDFMEQSNMKRKGYYPIFETKSSNPSYLVMKHTRFHNLTELLLEKMPNIKMVHIIRHPCAAIYSWLQAPNEFPKDDDPLKFWKNGKNRKTGKEEFWGFDDWVKLTKYYRSLAAQKADKVMIIRYENLVKHTQETVEKMLLFCGLNGGVPRQTVNFLKDSQTARSDNEYSVFRGENNVLDKWEEGLQEEIKQSIFKELKGSELEYFLSY